MGTNATGGSLYFDSGVNIDQLIADFNKAKQAANQFTNQVQKEGKQLDTAFSGLSGKLAAFFSIAAGAGLVNQIIKVRSEFQQLEISFQTMLGNKEKADKLMQEVIQFAATTPFELTNLASATKQLLAFGVASEDVMGIMKSMGDVSAGLGVPIERLILNFGQVKNMGKLGGRELRDFAVAGVPLLGELAKNLGKTEEAITAMVSAGKIGYEDVKKAFESMSGAGGRFDDLMAKQSKTMTGQISNLKDSVARMFDEIGQSQEGTFATVMRTLNWTVEHYQTFLDILKTLVLTYGAYRAAIALTNAVQGAGKLIEYITTLDKLRKGLISAAAAQKSLGIASMATPIGIAVAALAGLIALLAIFVFKTKKTQEYVNELNGSIADIGRQNETDKLVDKYLKLEKTTGDNVVKQNELKDSIVKLGLIFPEAVLRSDEYGRAIELNTGKIIAMNAQMREQLKIMSQGNIDESQNKLNDLLATRGRILETLAKRGKKGEMGTLLVSPETIKSQEELLIKTNAQIEELGNKLGKTKEELALMGSLDVKEAVTKAGGNYAELFAKVDELTKEEAEKRKKALTELSKAGMTSKVQSEISAQIMKLSKQIQIPIIQDKAYWEKKKKEAEEIIAALDSKSGTFKADKAIQDALILQAETELKKFESGSKSLKSAEKIAKKEQADEEKKNEALRKLAEERCQDELNAREKEISIMEEGFTKKTAEADFELQKELARIDKERQARVDAINDANGKKSGDKGFITSLSADDEKVFTDQIIGAVQIREYKIKELSKASADELLQIEKDLNAQLQTERDKDYQDVKDYYDNLRKEKKAALSPEDFAKVKPQIDEAEKTATKAIDSKYAIATIDMQENLALRENEINQVRQKNEHKYQESVLAIQKEFNQKRIKEVENLQDNESKKKLAGYKADEEALKKEQELLDEQNKQRQQDQLIAGAFEFADALLGASDASKEVKEQLGMALNVVGKLASGDYIGAAISLLAGLADEIMTLFESADAKSAKAIAKQNERLSEMISNAKLLSDTLSRTSGISYSSQSLKQLLYGLVTLNNTTIALNKLINTPTTGSYNWIGRSFSVVTQLNTEIEKIQQKLLSTSDKLTDKQRTQLEDQLKLYQEMMGSIDDAISSLTGSSVAELATGLQDAFLSGSDAAKNWGNTVEDVIKNIVKQQAISKLIMGPINKIVLDFLDSVSIYGMDGYAITKFKDDLSNAFGTIKPVWDAFTEGMKGIGIDISGANAAATAAKAEGLTGAIKGITAEQADLLGGVLISMREYQVKGYTETKGSFLTISDALNRQLTATNEIRQNELMKFNSQFTTLVEINRQTNQQIIDMRQFDLSEILIVNRQIAANTAYNKELPAIKAELIAMNAQIKNL